uniref:Septum site-determining protein MinD n=1 Tax=uncultured organism TaxID=155900 RepID=A0A7L9QC11_9ZZZZ|nr:septum site-determining protein MinD [uncultured organism]
MVRLHAETSANLPVTAAFVKDDLTKAMVAEALKGFGSTALVRQGDMEAAIAHITQDPSPRLIIVDLSGVDEPLKALDRLADVCMPDTRVIALGDVNDIHFYRMLRSAGVAEYLVKPVTAVALKTALMEPSVEAPQSAATKIEDPKIGPIVVIGARGGVGATMVAVSLAWISAERKRRRTVLVDLDLAFGSASLALDVEPGHGLSEALANPDRIDGLLVASATVKLGKHLYLLSSEQPLDGERPSQPDALKRLIAGLGQSFQHVVLDVPRADPTLLRQSLEQAGIIVIVTDFSLAGVRDTTRLMALAKKLAPTTKIMVAGNRIVDGKKSGLSQVEIEKALGVELTVAIPDDPAAIAYALNIGKPPPAANAASRSATALLALADAIDGTPQSSRPGLLSRLLPAAKREPKTDGEGKR